MISMKNVKSKKNLEINTFKSSTGEGVFKTSPIPPPLLRPRSRNYR